MRYIDHFLCLSVRYISQSEIPESRSKCNCNFERYCQISLHQRLNYFTLLPATFESTTFLKALQIECYQMISFLTVWIDLGVILLNMNETEYLSYVSVALYLFVCEYEYFCICCICLFFFCFCLGLASNFNFYVVQDSNFSSMAPAKILATSKA